MSTDDIAAIMAEQPSRARNELKSACRQAFEDASWAGVSQREQQRLTDGLIDMVFGFGPLESLLADDSVTEIMVNEMCIRDRLSTSQGDFFECGNFASDLPDEIRAWNGWSQDNKAEPVSYTHLVKLPHSNQSPWRVDIGPASNSVWSNTHQLGQ